MAVGALVGSFSQIEWGGLFHVSNAPITIEFCVAAQFSNPPRGDRRPNKVPCEGPGQLIWNVLGLPRTNYDK